MAGDRRDTGSTSGSERSPEEGNGNPLQYSCLDNPMGRWVWEAAVHKVAKSLTLFKAIYHACISIAKSSVPNYTDNNLISWKLPL